MCSESMVVAALPSCDLAQQEREWFSDRAQKNKMTDKNVDQAVRRRASMIVAEWNKAERVIKLAEMSDGSLVLPAIAELRYAGRRLVDFLAVYLEDNDNIEKLESISADALQNILRAKHDAIDAMVIKAGDEISEVIETHGAEVFPDVRDDIKAIQKIKSKIASTRSDRTARSDTYDQILEEDIERIFQISEKYSYYVAAKGKMVKRAWSLSLPAKTSATVVAAGGVVSAILGLLLALLGI